MTANFLDVWIIDNDTIRFWVTTIPDLTQKLIIAAALTVPVLGLLWWLDRWHRGERRVWRCAWSPRKCRFETCAQGGGIGASVQRRLGMPLAS